MLEVNVRGLADIERALQQLPDKLTRNVLRGALSAAARQIAEEARATAPRVTGELADSIRVSSRIVRGQPQASVKVGGRVRGKWTAFYAHMVERGTKAHEIRPKGAKSLFFAGITARLVNHPGARARRFLQQAADTRAAAAVEALKSYCRKRLAREGVDVPDPEPEEG